MRILNSLKKTYRKLERQKAIKILTTIDPEKILLHGENELVKAFHRAAERVPAYGSLLKKRGIDISKVTDVRSFRELVPVITKADVFPDNDIQNLCLDGRLERMKTPMSSSGFSGVFSFGINTADNLLNAEKSIDTALDYIFDISRKRTFMINCVPMGVKIPTSLPVADTSVRADMALAIFKKFSAKFDQTIFVSDPHFLKKILEDGLEQGINWEKENVHLVSGEDWFSESFRSYVSDILGTDWDNNPQRGIFGATMGIAELDLNLFHESIYSIRIRRAAESDQKLRYALFGEGVDVTPILFHYYPHKTFLEALGNDAEPRELVFSMLSKTLLIPLIRYNSKDVGSIISYKRMKQVLHECGYSHLCPDLKLPLVAVGGRKGRSISLGETTLSPEQARSLLYSDYELARRVTGNFLIVNDDDKIVVQIQLKEGEENSDDTFHKFKNLFGAIPGTDVQLFSYHEFKHGMKLDYETKFRHIV